MSNYTSNTFTRDEENHPWSRIFNLIEEGSRILDIGCSSGNLGATLIKEKKCEVVGIDLDAKDVKLASERLSEAHVMNAETDNLSPLGKFDNIIFADVIEHLVDPVTTLKRVKESLKPGGSVIFSIPNMAHIATRLMLLEGSFKYAETGLLDKTHLHYYDQEEVKRVFSEAGYDIEVFNWAERYVPEKILSERLKNIGLIATEEFYERTKQVDAVAYEYVGRSVVASHKSTSEKLPFVSPHVLFVEEQIDLIERSYNDQLINQRNQYEEKIDKLEHKEVALISSISWRVTLPLRLVNGFIVKVRRKIRTMIYAANRNPKLNLLHRKEFHETKREYQRKEQLIDAFKKSKNVDVAVVLHLFYPETWPVLKQKIHALQTTIQTDVYISLPYGKGDFSEQIKKDLPDARVITLPNWGRDVLPFLYIGAKLQTLGYKYLLKIHSKKSPHRDDGDEWFTGMLDSLMPENKDILTQLRNVLEDKSTGIIGPKNQYISLRVNYESNSYFFIKSLSKITSKKQAILVENNRGEYGFFAGTMFWARVDSISKIFEANFTVDDFEREVGRIDGTFAHALERVFCILPELEGKCMYEAKDQSIDQIALKTYNIPNWSDVHPDNFKNKKSRKKKI